MIRNSVGNDLVKISNMLEAEVGEFDKDLLADRFNNNFLFLVDVDEKEEVQAFVSATLSKVKPDRALLAIYVSEAARGRGIGSELHRRCMDSCRSRDVHQLILDIRTEKADTGAFFEHRGIQKWYGDITMEYKGGLRDCAVQLVNYEPDHYERYKEAFEDCYLELRQAHGFFPLKDCYTAEELMGNRNDIFLLMDEEDIIGSVRLHDGELDDLFVSQKYQGKGHTKTLLDFSISHLQKLGVQKIWLGVVEWNEKARGIYHRYGFAEVKRTDAYKAEI